MPTHALIEITCDSANRYHLTLTIQMTVSTQQPR